MLPSSKSILLLLCWALYGAINAATIYVDTALTANCTSSNYSIANRSAGGHDGNAYTTIAAAINAMTAGDSVVLRRGTHTGGNIAFPSSKNGTSWQPGHFSTLMSYPGEWAVIDGKNNVTSQYAALGHYQDVVSYWKLERLEIKNGATSDGSSAGGFIPWEGPFIVRYCYIHDNATNDNGRNNPSGIGGEGWHSCLIEYCYFKDNGSKTGTNLNCANIASYSDYVENPLNVNIANASQKNEYRYNLIEGSPVGYKNKNSQWLSLDHSGNDMRYKDYGDKIHHNIFKNQSALSIWAVQDFVQVYNNITISSSTPVANAQLQSTGDNDREPFYATVYNNTFIKTRFGAHHGMQDADGSSYDLGETLQDINGLSFTVTRLHPHFYGYNNIFDNVKALYDGSYDFNIMRTWSSWTENDIDMSLVKVENNLFWPRSSTENIIELGPIPNYYSADGYKLKGYSTTMYTSTASGLHKTGSAYKTDGTFSLGSGKTIANGGIGGSHPYLSGITLPLYVGATDPGNDGWVDSVLALVNLPKSISTATGPRLSKAPNNSGMTIGTMEERAGKIDFEVNSGLPGKIRISIIAVSGKILWKHNVTASLRPQKISWNPTGVGHGTYLLVLSQNGRQVTMAFAVAR